MLRLFQDSIMRADAPEEVIILMDFKSKAIEHVDARFPAVFMPFHLFDPEGGMADVVHEAPYLLIKFCLNVFGKPLVILLEDSGAEDFSFLEVCNKVFYAIKGFCFSSGDLFVGFCLCLWPVKVPEIRRES